MIPGKLWVDFLGPCLAHSKYPVNGSCYYHNKAKWEEMQVWAGRGQVLGGHTGFDI